MKISELASRTQVAAKTIRYYEQIGLLQQPQRGANGYRYYHTSDVDTLVFIRRCRELNIAIDDIKRLVEAQHDPKASCSVINHTIAEQLIRVREMQKELALLEHTLSNLSASCQQDQIEDCQILHTLKSN